VPFAAIRDFKRLETAARGLSGVGQVSSDTDARRRRAEVMALTGTMQRRMRAAIPPWTEVS